MANWDLKSAFDTYYDWGAEPWGKPATRQPIVLHYHWRPILRWQEIKFAPLLWNVLGLNPGDSVVIVGAGFNGTGAGLQSLGADVIATDLSNYIQNEKGNTEEAELRAAIIAAGLDPDTHLVRDTPLALRHGATPGQLYLDWALEGGIANPQPRGRGTIMAEDMHNKPSRNQIRNALASNARYGITEELLNSVDDATALQICDYAAQFAAETGATIVHMISPYNPLVISQWADLNWKTYAAWRAFLDTNGFSAQLILPTVTAPDQGMAFPDLSGWVQICLNNGMNFADAQTTAADKVAGNWVAAYWGTI